MDELAQFGGSRPNEKVLANWNQHPWVLVQPGLVSLAGLLAVAVVIYFFGASGMIRVLIVIGIGLSVAVSARAYYIYWAGSYILTTQRFIEIDQVSVFHQKVTELPIQNIQYVSCEVKGPWAALLNYGNFVIRTENSPTTITANVVPAVYEVQNTIVDARNDYLKNQPN